MVDCMISCITWHYTFAIARLRSREATCDPSFWWCFSVCRGNPAALGAAATTSLFDGSLRHNARLLLTALARKDPQVVFGDQGHQGAWGHDDPHGCHFGAEIIRYPGHQQVERFQHVDIQ